MENGLEAVQNYNAKYNFYILGFTTILLSFLLDIRLFFNNLFKRCLPLCYFKFFVFGIFCISM